MDIVIGRTADVNRERPRREESPYIAKKKRKENITWIQIISRVLFNYVHFLCLPKENEPKERALFQRYFSLFKRKPWKES